MFNKSIETGTFFKPLKLQAIVYDQYKNVKTVGHLP